MINMFKKDGAVSSIADGIKRGNRGRIELFATRTKEGFIVSLVDYGNYGRERYSANFNNLSKDEIVEMIASLQMLVHGEIDTTVSFPQDNELDEIMDGVEAIEIEEFEEKGKDGLTDSERALREKIMQE